MSKKKTSSKCPANIKDQCSPHLYEPACSGANKATSFDKRGHLSSDPRVNGAASVNALTETLASLQSRLCATETLAGDNFTALAVTEITIKTLKEQNVTLLDRVDDLENRSRRSNLRILNVPENSEKDQSSCPR